MTFLRHGGLIISSEFLSLLSGAGLDSFDRLMDFSGGTVLKKKGGRSITKIDLSGKSLFLKRHQGGKNRLSSLLSRWKSPEDGRNEWNNMLLLRDLGMDTATPVAFGERKRGGIPCSLTLTEEIGNAEKLETFMPRRFAPPLDPGRVTEKRDIIGKLGRLARKMHGEGFHHQDFYLGHLFLGAEDGRIFLLDLQRMHRNDPLGRRAKVKDLAQLLYSAGETGVLSARDCLRFARAYFGGRRFGKYEREFMALVLRKRDKIARHDAKLKLRRMREFNPSS